LTRRGYTVLHDRSLPHSRANVDHLVIGPCGVIIIDTKNWAKNTKIIGGRFNGGKGRTYIGRTRAAKKLGGITYETSVVARELTRELHRQVAVTPLVAVHGARRMRWGALKAEGVTLLYAPRARRWIRRLPPVCDPAEVAELAAAAARLFPPYPGG
jgi:hypothetical protein